MDALKKRTYSIRKGCIGASLIALVGMPLVAEEGDHGSAPARVYGRHVPERMDDFAWENDRVAFRMYGPKLEASGEISSGIDVWSKSTTRLVIDDWYRAGDYHVDHGEGADFYKVGRSLGCGGSAVYSEGKLQFSRNWTGYEILDRGPEAFRFRLSYDSWKVGECEFTETKTISLQAGSSLNQIETVLESSDKTPVVVAIGIVLREGKGGVLKMDEEKGVLMYWEPGTAHGHTGCGIVVDPNSVEDMVIAEGHALVLVRAEIGKPISYRAGACWSESGFYPTPEKWEDYLSEEAGKAIQCK